MTEPRTATDYIVVPASGAAPITLTVERVSKVLFDVFPADDATNDLIFEVLARLAAPPSKKVAPR